jgi:heptosyltransferase-2
MAPRFDPSAVRRIFVRAPNWVGDLVMATASFARIRAAFPGAHIACGLRPNLRPLLAGTTWFDELVDAPRAGSFGGLRAQVQAMRQQRYDLAVVMPNSLETALVPFLARVPNRLGYRQGRPFLLTMGPKARVRRHWFQRRIGPRRFPSPMPQYYRALLDGLGIPGDALHPHLAVTGAERQWVAQDLAARGVLPDERLLLLVVGANYGSSKLWLPERFAAVARHFQERHGMRALVVVGPAEVELGERIAQEGGALALTQPVLPLDKLKALVERSTLMVTGDTGPRHLAVAFDKPIVCLMGPSDPAYTDYCMERTALIRKDLPCSPCQRKVCPLGHHRCMKDITALEVIAAAERLIVPSVR